TLHECATSEKPHLDPLPHFGCTVWVRVDAASKLNLKSHPGHWVGFDVHSNGHRMYWADKHKVSVECNAKSGQNVPTGTSLQPPSTSISAATITSSNVIQPPATVPNESTNVNTEPLQPESMVTKPKSMPEAGAGHPKRVCQPSQWIRDLQSGTGTTGGRGAQHVPRSI
ncbi:uncharacterized protein LAESUDRAFT_628501, partial [Laetiporus sulphureus 93-53]